MFVTGLLVVGALAPLRATASIPPEVTVEHFAPIPCSVACAHWEAPDAAGFDACADPFPAGSYDFSTFRLTATSGVVTIEARSVIDYDTFVCTTTEPSVHVGTVGSCGWRAKCTSIGDECTGIAGRDALAVGCIERKSVTWSALTAANGGANDEFRLISYNWSDTAPLPIGLWGPVALVDDSYDASPL
jgi:hypothetical protein